MTVLQIDPTVLVKRVVDITETNDSGNGELEGKTVLSCTEDCTELLIDVATLDNDLPDVETLDTLALLDGATELETEWLDTKLVVAGSINVLDVIVVLALDDVPLLELGDEEQYIEDEDEYTIGDDELIAGEELILVEAIWVPLDVGEPLSLNTVLTVVVDGAMLLEMPILEEE